MTNTHIGKTVYVSAALPATNDAAGFEALTWTKADGVIQAPKFEITNSLIDVPDLQTGLTTAVKGGSQGVETQPTWRTISGDAGQAIIIARADDKQGTMSFKVVDGSGANNAPVTGDPVEYSQGVCKETSENEKVDGQYEGFTATFRPNAAKVIATE